MAMKKITKTLLFVTGLLISTIAAANDSTVIYAKTTASVPDASVPANNGTVIDAKTKAPVPDASVSAYNGTVIDAKTKAPIADASVTIGDVVVKTAANGTFHIEGKSE